jgi:hypothetical protein
MGSVESQHPDVEPGMEEVTKNDDTWDAVQRLVNERSEEYISKYGYRLRVKKLWRVRPSSTVQQQETQAMHLGEPTQLFHGTSMENALKISKWGFRLPTKKGMFGHGIYFADTPLKSAKFAPEKKDLQKHVQSFATKGFWQGLADLMKDRKESGQMLLCDVYLGKTKTVRRSCNNFDPEHNLKGGWFRDFTGLGDFDSVYAPGGWLSAVNVPEYVIYQPLQGIPRYLIEFEYQRPY